LKKEIGVELEDIDVRFLIFKSQPPRSKKFELSVRLFIESIRPFMRDASKKVNKKIVKDEDLNYVIGILIDEEKDKNVVLKEDFMAED